MNIFKHTKTSFVKKILLIPIMILLGCNQKKDVPSDKLQTIQQKDSFVSDENKNDIEIISDNGGDILDSLVNEEAGGDKDAKIDLKNHSVRFDNDGDSYEVTFSKLASQDFNDDGIVDFIVEKDSEGALGGNANSNAEIIYLILDAKQNIKERHHILLYAPFSYNILENISFENGKLKATATQNFRTYSSGSGEDLQTTDLSFIYKDSNVYEESYLSQCKLGQWKNKKILKSPIESVKLLMNIIIQKLYQKNIFKKIMRLPRNCRVVII